MAAHAKNHDYHLVDPSPWPLIGGISAFLMASGFVVWLPSCRGSITASSRFRTIQGQTSVEAVARASQAIRSARSRASLIPA